jgi:hypothetical protein
MSLSDRNKQHQVPENRVENHMHQGQPNMENSFLSGIKQRLLSFIFQGIWNEETDDSLVSLINSLLIAQSSFYMFYLAMFLCLTCCREFIIYYLGRIEAHSLFPNISVFIPFYFWYGESFSFFSIVLRSKLLRCSCVLHCHCLWTLFGVVYFFFHRHTRVRMHELVIPLCHCYAHMHSCNNLEAEIIIEEFLLKMFPV